MSDWDPEQYLRFGDERTRPARDLAMHVGIKPGTIVDVGCGPGNSTLVLRDMFPDADIEGIDSSPEMIEKARSGNPGMDFRVGDARCLDGNYDLIYSNACLQWIPDHETLIPSLMERLNEGGVLAVQMPMNAEEPLYRLIDDVVREPKWKLDPDIHSGQVLTPGEYHNILSSCSSAFDMWETRYYHRMPDHRALVEWVKGSRLRPYLECLDDQTAREFEDEIVERSKDLYPVMDDGNVVLGFRRFFFTAVR